ncbi:catecholate siderophore receptor [Rubritalea squalenifaciens DSM 18772]|uniref:Catecholate siderophore receptor n=1 Tax=Rubritalea squalenifaciens DSM 18772 TaxID=1123071 RepID=A0A1M6P581_9BACT|nr:TonB-dependent siderophore receptor [Rubritalea squalenifaciens]SHK03119.1 catecholate siderophore receptor [Rubritalea squalenifaciens DSM 18772]
MLEQAPTNNLRHAALLSNRTAATSVAGAMLIAGQLTTQAAPQGQNQSEPQKTETLDPSVLTADENAKLKPGQLSSSRYTAPLRDIPRTVTVVPEALIKQQNATTVQDALRNVPGISLQAGEGGTPAGDQLSIRGFSARTDFFVDGVRDIGGYTRDPFNYEQIEVSKGPSSTDSGRGGTGGSINLATKTPKLDGATDASISLGTDSFARATLDYNQPLSLEGAAFRLNLMGHTAYVPGRDYVKQQRWGFAPSLAFGLGTDTVTTLSYMHMSQDNVPDYGIPWVNDEVPSGVDFDNWYGLLSRDYEHVDTDIFTAEIKHRVNENFDLRGIARYGRNYRDSIITAPRLVGGTDDTIRRTDEKFRKQTNSIASIAVDANIRFETGDWKHTLVTGADYSRERDKNVNRTSDDSGAPDTDLYNPNPHGTDNSIYSYTGTTVGRADTIGIFVYDTIELNDQWILNGGVRFENFDAEVGDLTQDDNLFNWRASITYKPTENGSIYFAYGTSSNPSAESLSFGRSDALAGVDPEETETFELGTKWDLLNERLHLSAALFRTNKTNARTRASNSDPYELEGDLQVQGVEFGLAGEITDTWSIFAGYTYMDSEIKKDLAGGEGNGLGNTPEHSVSIWNTFDVTDKLALAGGVRYVGERDNGRGRIADDYITFDAAATYQINDSLSAQLNLLNIADERYVDQVGGGHFIPGPGRSASISLNYSF